MIELYDKNGYINFQTPANSGCPFNWLIGGRGIGKTYGGLKFLSVDNNFPFIYMRRTQRQIELSCLPSTMPFKKINEDFGRKIKPKTEKDFITFHENGIKIAFGASLSTFYNLRGVSLEEYGDLLFDEIIPEPMERTRKGEGRALLDALETINRNRELQGKRPVKCYFLGNSDMLNSDILRAFGIISIIEKMVADKKEFYINHQSGNAVFYYSGSPISEKKRETALYKASKNKAFKDKAIENEFADLRDSIDIKRIPLNECRIFCNIDNEIGVYEHKTGAFFYACRVCNKGGRTFHMLNANERRTFAWTYADIIRDAMASGAIFYDSFESKSALENFVFNY